MYCLIYISVHIYNIYLQRYIENSWDHFDITLFDWNKNFKIHDGYRRIKWELKDNMSLRSNKQSIESRIDDYIRIEMYVYDKLWRK